MSALYDYCQKSQVGIQLKACNKDTSDLGLVGGYPYTLWFSLPLTTGQERHYFSFTNTNTNGSLQLLHVYIAIGSAHRIRFHLEVENNLMLGDKSMTEFQ